MQWGREQLQYHVNYEDKSKTWGSVKVWSLTGSRRAQLNMFTKHKAKKTAGQKSWQTRMEREKILKMDVWNQTDLMKNNKSRRFHKRQEEKIYRTNQWIQNCDLSVFRWTCLHHKSNIFCILKVPTRWTLLILLIWWPFTQKWMRCHLRSYLSSSAAQFLLHFLHFFRLGE